MQDAGGFEALDSNPRMKTALIVALIAVLASFGAYTWYSGLRSSEPLLAPQRKIDLSGAALQERLQQSAMASGVKMSEAEATEQRLVEPTETAPSNRLLAFQQTIARIKAQPYDKTWAGNAEREITASFAEILNSRQASPAGSPARLLDVECRRDACVVNIEWPTYGQASAGWESLLLAPMKPNCDREVVLEESIDLTGPYPTQVAITNCAP